MPKFIIRYREVFIYDLEVESTSLKASMQEFQKKLQRKRPPPDSVLIGLRYEVESVNLRTHNDCTNFRRPDPDIPPKRARAKAVALKNRHLQAEDCESGAS